VRTLADLKVTDVAAVAPKVTLEVALKPDPTMVTGVPPTSGPVSGLIHSTDGTTYAKRSNAVTADVPAGVVTVASVHPGVPAGVNAVIVVAERTMTPLAGVPPNDTVVPATNPVPLMITDVPPLVGPPLGSVR